MGYRCALLDLLAGGQQRLLCLVGWRVGCAILGPASTAWPGVHVHEIALVLGRVQSAACCRTIEVEASGDFLHGNSRLRVFRLKSLHSVDGLTELATLFNLRCLRE